jgi:hypothetical protein
MRRRHFVQAGSAALLAGCAAEPSAPPRATTGGQAFVGPGAPSSAAPARAGSFAPSTPSPTMPGPAALSSAPRALLAARVAEGPELAMILADTRQGQEQWLAPGPFVLALRSGRVIRTVNLDGLDLKGVVDETPDPLRGPVAALGNAPYRRRLQATGAPAGGWLVEGRMTAEGNETLTVPGLGTQRQALRVRERGRALDGNWRFENVFWLDPRTGQVLASRQVPLPGAPTVTLNLIKAG